MQNAAVFEKQQKYPEAANAYQAALTLMPKDARAKVGFGFNSSMAEGQKAMKERRFPDAVRSFEAALKIMPNHPAATAALKQAKSAK
jgi:cytochrome c-type biogenesis protein CcmH/NrfG